LVPGYNNNQTDTMRAYSMGTEPRGPAVLFFFAPWCGHCTAAKPEVVKAGRALAAAGVPVFAVDGDKPAHEALMKRFRVDGFPTLFYVNREGRRARYGGERTAAAIERWACRRSGKACAAPAKPAATKPAAARPAAPKPAAARPAAPKPARARTAA